MRKRLLVVLAASLTFPPPISAQAPAPGGTQVDLAMGIRQVEEGDLEGAVITLDTVAQRLKQEKGREKDLATAHLYLAMTHLGLSQWERAKGEMREAWRNNRQLTLDPKKFPPRVIQLYEQTKQEGRRVEVAPPPRPAPAASAPPAPKATPVLPKAALAAPAKKGGSKALWIGLGVAAAGGGVAAAAGGGGGGSTSTKASCQDSAPVTLTNARFERAEVPCPVGTFTTDNVVLINAVNPRCQTVTIAGSSGVAALRLTVVDQQRTSNPVGKTFTQGFPNSGPPFNTTEPTSLPPGSTTILRVPTGASCRNVGSAPPSQTISEGQTGGYYVMSGQLDIPTSAGHFALTTSNTWRTTFP